ncbi:MAG: hypothetical protein WCY78_03845 [Sphaerochaetaceae bacterium]
MKRFFTLLIIALVVLGLSSCMTYRYERAKALIRETEKSSFVATKLASIEYPLELKETPLVKFEALFVPLPQEPSEALLDELLTNLENTSSEIVAIIGHEAHLDYIASRLNKPSYRLAKRSMLITPYKLTQTPKGQLILAFNPHSKLVVAMVETGNYDNLKNLLMKRPQDGVPIEVPSGASPTIVFAALAEPSSEDWFETAANHPYRSTERWPGSDYFREGGYGDTWRATHFNALSDPGITWSYLIEGEVKIAERIDYIFTKGVIPLESTTVRLYSPEGQEERYAIEASFVIP